MNTPNSAPRASRSVSRLLVLAAALAVGPTVAQAQGSGKWLATIAQIPTVGGSADLTIEPRNDKQSRAKLSFRNGGRDRRIAWDIVAGRCRDDGLAIAAQATFTQVQTQMDGSGTASANIPKLESGKLYYVRVFDPQSPASDATAYACANISEKP